MGCVWCGKETQWKYCTDHHRELCLDYPMLFGESDVEGKTEPKMVEAPFAPVPKLLEQP